MNVSRLVQRLKALSATVANKEHHGDGGIPLYWAKGYAAKTVDPEGLDRVRAYLQAQPSHHPEEAIPGWFGDANREFDSSDPRRSMRKKSHLPYPP